jgi:hypothetical protein
VNRFRLALFLLIVSGCSTTTYKAVTYRRTVTTYLEVTSNVPAEVWVSDRHLGTTPLSFPFNYEEEVDRNVKTANYWETNPGTAAALSVLSFGTYIPFSFIRAEPTSESHPSGAFVNNKTNLRLTADGYEPLIQELELTGEAKRQFTFTLVQKAGE